MATIVNLYDAKTNLSELVERAARGEEIVIAKAGKPKARLLGLAVEQKKRKPGALKGKIWIADDFDSHIPPEFEPYLPSAAEIAEAKKGANVPVVAAKSQKRTK